MFTCIVDQPDPQAIGQHLAKATVDPPLRQLEAGFTETLSLELQDDDSQCLCGTEPPCNLNYHRESSSSCYNFFDLSQVQIQVVADEPSIPPQFDDRVQVRTKDNPPNHRNPAYTSANNKVKIDGKT